MYLLDNQSKKTLRLCVSARPEGMAMPRHTILGTPLIVIPSVYSGRAAPLDAADIFYY